jgi:hypothetical protein
MKRHRQKVQLLADSGEVPLLSDGDSAKGK